MQLFSTSILNIYQTCLHHLQIIGIILFFKISRGLHNLSSAVKIRVSYLFLRFLKQLKNNEGLSQSVEHFLRKIYDCLSVEQPPSSLDSARPGSASTSSIDGEKTFSIVESQLFLFESVGKLISVEKSQSKQTEYLFSIMNPLMSKMKSILCNIMLSKQSEKEIMHLSHLILVIGATAKGKS
jgi:exportin-T